MTQLEVVGARGEPGYVDQVPRRERYQETHPNVEIIYCGPHWKAIIRDEADGSTEINRLSLEAMLNKLESLDEPAATT
jgi:hypothetical protein